MIHRRGLLRGLVGMLAAPAIIRTPGLLMPIKPQRLSRMEDFAIGSYMIGSNFSYLPGLGKELAAITRKAMIPTSFTQIYQAEPWLEEALASVARNVADVIYNG